MAFGAIEVPDRRAGNAKPLLSTVGRDLRLTTGGDGETARSAYSSARVGPAKLQLSFTQPTQAVELDARVVSTTGPGQRLQSTLQGDLVDPKTRDSGRAPKEGPAPACAV